MGNYKKLSKMVKGDKPVKSKNASAKKLEPVKKPSSMKKKKTSQGSTPKKVITKSKKDQKKSIENKAMKSRQSQSQEKTKKKRSRKQKKEVDPDRPKKPQVAYFLWMNEKGRESIKKKNPADFPHKQVLIECGKTWQTNMSDSQKKP